MVGPAPAPDSATATAAAAPGRAGRGGLTQATAQSMATLHADVFRRGYALVVFNPNDCAEDTTLRNPDGSWAFRNTRFYPAYPGYDWGILAGWAWGASRVADYLEKDPTIDKSKLIITEPRGMASSMIAAALDERLMGAPCNRRWHVGPTDSPARGRAKRWTSWRRSTPIGFLPNLHEFQGQREKLPFDEHCLLALAAPRPFITLEGDTTRFRRKRSRSRSSRRARLRTVRCDGQARRELREARPRLHPRRLDGDDGLLRPTHSRQENRSDVRPLPHREGAR